MFFPLGSSHIATMPPAPETYNIPNPSVPQLSSKHSAETTESSSVECNKSKANHVKAIASDSRNECYQNYKGGCKIACGLTHIFRPPKQLIVCAIYAETGRCPNERRCRFMHSDYPCKYYYLGVPHPDSDTKCAYSHGEPLDSEVICGVLADAQRSRMLGPDSTYESVKLRFKSRNNELKELYGFSAATRVAKGRPQVPARACIATNSTDTQCNPNSPNLAENSMFHSVLTEQQILALAEKGVESLEQLIVLSVAEQRACGLSVQQIFLLHLEAGNVNAFKKASSQKDAQNQNTREDTGDQTCVTVNTLRDETESSLSTEQKLSLIKSASHPRETCDKHQLIEENANQTNVQCTLVEPCDNELPAGKPLIRQTYIPGQQSLQLSHSLISIFRFFQRRRKRSGHRRIKKKM